MPAIRQSPFSFDVSDMKSVKAGMKDIADAFGKIDVLINNAGINVGPDEREKPWKTLTRIGGKPLTRWI